MLFLFILNTCHVVVPDSHFNLGVVGIAPITYGAQGGGRDDTGCKRVVRQLCHLNIKLYT